MFNFFKPRDKGTEPIELFEYCAKRQLSGFSLLTYLAVIARHQGGVDSGGFRQEIFNEYFAFFLGKACWIAETNNRFSEHEFRALFGNLPWIDPKTFTNNGASQGVLALLQSFFEPRSGNESRVAGYCGNFLTEIADERLRNCLIDALQETGWDGEQWEWGGGPLT